MIRLRRPSAFAVALTVSGAAAFIALGVWQLHRATWKEALLARFAQADGAPLVTLAQAERVGDSDRYPHVAVSGRFDTQRIYLLDDQMRAGQLGVMVFAPFHPDHDARALLVNLGFLPRRGPDVALPEPPPLPSHEVSLAGIYAPPPRPGLKLGGNPLLREKAWPKLVTWIDLHDIAADLHQALHPRVLLLDPDPHTAYVRLWKPDTFPPSRHRAYALQWFGFAVVAVVMFFVLHRVKDGDAGRPE